MRPLRLVSGGALAMAVAGSACSPAPGTSPTGARDIAWCEPVVTELLARGTDHWFRLPGVDAPDRRVWVRVESPLAERLTVAAFSPTGERIAAAASGPAPDLLLMDGLPVFDEATLIEVRFDDVAPLLRRDAYQLHACHRPAFLGEEREPNDRTAWAQALAFDEEVVGYLGHDEDVEVLRLPAQGSHDAEVRVTGPSGVDLRLELLNADGELVRTVDRQRVGRGEQVRLTPSERQEVEFVRIAAADRDGGTKVWRASVAVLEAEGSTRAERAFARRRARARLGEGDDDADEAEAAEQENAAAEETE